MKRWAMVVAAASSFAAASADAQPHGSVEPPAPAGSAVAEAQTRFRRALELHQEGNLDAARAELQRAYQTAPSYKVLYNLAQIEFELLDYPAALVTFEKYLADGGDKISKERRAHVQNDIEKLRGRVATLEIAVNVPNARVVVDDIAVGTTPLGRPLVVSAGRRRIAVNRPGFSTETRIVDLGGGDRSTVNIELSDVSHSAPDVSAVAPAHSPSAALSETAPAAIEPTPRASVPWLGWGLTALFAAGAAATGGLALDASNKLSAERSRSGADPDDLDRLRTQATSFALVSDISTGAAAFAGLISLYITLASGKTGGAEQGRALRVSPSAGSVSIAGTF